MASHHRSALVAKGSKVIAVSAADVGSVVFRRASDLPRADGATRSARPSWSRSVTSSPETGPGIASILEHDVVEIAQAVVEDGHGRRTVGGEHQVEVAVAVHVEDGDPGVWGLSPQERLHAGPGHQRQGQAAFRLHVLPGHGQRRPGGGRASGDRLGLAVVAVDRVRQSRRGRLVIQERLAGMLGCTVIHDVEVEVAILVEVEPPRHEGDRGRANGLEGRGEVVEALAIAVVEQAILADAGEEEVDLPVGVEIGGRDAQAGLVQGQAECGRGILEAVVSLVHEQGVAQSLGADHSRGQVEIELAVAVDVEGRRRRSEAGADPGDDGMVSLEIVGRGPAVAGGELDLERFRRLEPGGNRRWAAVPWSDRGWG